MILLAFSTVPPRPLVVVVVDVVVVVVVVVVGAVVVGTRLVPRNRLLHLS